MSFINDLRMSGIFNPGRGLSFPEAEGYNPDVISSVANRVLPLIQMKNRDDEERAQRMAVFNKQLEGYNPNAARVGAIGAAMRGSQGLQQQGPNVVYKPSISDYQREQLALKGEDLDIKKALGEGRLNLMGGDQDIRQQRADTYDFKSKNPALKLQSTKGGNFFAFNPLTGEMEDTGINTGTMTDEGKLNLTGENALNAISARGENATNLQKLRGEQNLQAIGARLSGKSNTTPKPELPTQTRVRQINAARELANTDKELGQFISFDSGGNVVITPPSTNFFGSATGPSLAQYAKLKKAIYGDSTPTMTAATSNTKDTKKTETKQPTSKYKVTVED